MSKTFKQLRPALMMMPLMAALTFFSPFIVADYVVVGSLDVPDLTESQIRKIFLKKMKQLSDGSKLEPVDLAEDSDLKREFYQEVMRKNMSLINAYWSRKIFSGRGSPPIQVNGREEMIKHIKETPGAIGYLDAKDVDEGMKVLLHFKAG